MKDLAVLAADNNMAAVLRSLLTRNQALGIRPVGFDVFVHPRRDPGCVHEAHLFLAALSDMYAYSLVLFDHQGSGQEQLALAELAGQVTNRLEASGWHNRSRTIVLAPELEVWVWSPSPHVATCLGWESRTPDLRSWLQSKGYWSASRAKPADPKAAMEAVLREVRRPRSSAIYAQLANTISLRGHNEPAFVALVQALHEWFGAD